MAVQIPLDETALAQATRNGALHEVAPDLAYIRCAIVNVIFVGRPGQPGWTLIDAGVTGSGGRILGAARDRFGAGVPPQAIVLTHGHFDHVGALQHLLDEWNVPVFAHPLERPYLTGKASYPPPDTDAEGGIMPRLSPLFPRSPIDITGHLQDLPAGGAVPPLPDWKWVFTPGHTPGHVSLWRSRDRAVIAGDAFITTGQESAYEVLVQAPEMHGPPRYFTPDWIAAEESVKTLAALGPDLAITGHGRPMQGEDMRAALRRLAAEFRKIAVPAS